MNFADNQKLDLRGFVFKKLGDPVSPQSYDIFSKVEFGLTELGLLRKTEVASGWDNSFSDPRQHNPRSFRYLVHGLQDQFTRCIQDAALIMLPGSFDFSQRIDLSLSPGAIRDKKLISASIIDQDHLATFGSAGLILSAPSSNVIDMSHEDCGTNFKNPDYLLNKKPKLMPVEQILSRTGQGLTDWNEIRLTGRTENGEVQVAGFWIKVDERGIPSSPEVAERMRSLAKILSLPLITFVIQSEAILDQKPEIHDTVESNGVRRQWAVSLNFGGLRYFVNLDKGEAVVINRHREQRPMSVEEAHDFKNRLISSLEKDSSITERLDRALAKCAG